MYRLCFCACASVVRAPAAPMEGGEATAVGGVPAALDILLFGEIYSYISDPSGLGGAGFEPTTSFISSPFDTHTGQDLSGENSDRGFLQAFKDTLRAMCSVVVDYVRSTSTGS